MLQSPDIYVAALFMSSLRRILRWVSPGRSELVNCQPSVSALSPAQHSTDKVTLASTAHYSLLAAPTRGKPLTIVPFQSKM